MFGKKKVEEPKVEKNKIVYDVEKDGKENDEIEDLLSQADVASNGNKNNVEFTLPLVGIEDVSLTNNQDNDTEKEKPKKNIKHIFVGVILAILIGCVCFLTWAINSDLFTLKTIIIPNGVNVSSGDIMNIVSGDIGINLFLIKTGNIEKRIKENPYINKVKVKKVFPDSLKVEYEEILPYMILGSGDSKIYVDKKGTVISQSNEIDYNVGVVIKFDVNNNYKDGEQLSGVDNIKYKNAVYLMQAAKNIGFEYNIYMIEYEDAESMKLYIENADIDVLYGAFNKEQVDEKLLRLNSIIKETIDKNLKGIIDVSAKNYYEKSVLITK